MIVMKFGGTSVEDAVAMKRTISIVENKLAQKPVVVVSACAKVTDSLYEIIEDIRNDRKNDAEKVIKHLYERHWGIVTALDGDKHALLDGVKAKIDAIFAIMNNAVDKFCGKEMPDAEKALLISSGEYLSSNIIAYAMNSMGIKTAWFDAREIIITNDDLMKASPIMEEVSNRAKPFITKAYKGMDAVITQGFIASNIAGKPSLLGRGGSDYSASLIGMAIDADRIEIWTDVDGVRTADPRIVENTKGLKKLSYEEAAELARFGAKVLHPLTLEPAELKNIPLYVLNSRNPEGEGTAILSQSCIFDGIKSISYKENIRVINVYTVRMINTSGFMNNVFDVFSKHGISVDLISSSEASITVTVEASQDVQSAVEELKSFGNVTIDRDKAQISIIGKNIIGVRGLLSETFNATIDSKIYMISQGATYRNLSFVVDRPIMAEILRKLHQAFFENENFN
ncbi:MAG: aspartate kinase [Bacteroidales bacterium]|nr:aspartate kinase [Bacteroidales bacterium]